MYLHHFATEFHLKRALLLSAQIWILFFHRCLMPGLVEIDQMDLEKKDLNIINVFSLCHFYLSLKKKLDWLYMDACPHITSWLLDMVGVFQGWSKGVVFINYFNIGRYWSLHGPQQRLYVPGSILHNKKANTVRKYIPKSLSISLWMISNFDN